MQRSKTLISAILLALAPLAAMSNAAPFTTAPDPIPATPAIFPPGAIAGDADDGAAAFSPDGNTVVFMRSTDGSTLMQSHRADGRWTTPTVAPFSGRWRDLDPAMAPDGSYLLFVSNRPVSPGAPPLDAVSSGKRRVGQGMNLWRVDRRGGGWGTPVRLPDIVNACSMTFAPSVAADGSVYFIGCAADGGLHLLRSVQQDRHYLAPFAVALGDAGMRIRDPAIAPDRSFIVVSTKREEGEPYRLAIAFHTPAGWSALQDLGDAVNGGKHSMGAQLGPDGRTLFFYSDRRMPPSSSDHAAAWNNGDDHIWQISLAPWLDAHAAGAVPASGPLAAGPWTQERDASPAFAPDGDTVLFARGQGITRRVFVARRDGGGWSEPQPAPFSGGAWMDMEPAMAPDGSFLVFASNRPSKPDGTVLDGHYEGQSQPGRGGNLWRVERTAHGWSTPRRLPGTVNAGSSIYAPAVAADSSVYFMQPDPHTGHFRLYLARFADGRYHAPRALPFSDGQIADYDPVVAPDQSFIVFSSDRPPSTDTRSAIFIAFARADGGWSTPVPLGPAGTESRLSPDRATLYFSDADQRIHRFALADWVRRHAARP